MKIRGFVFAAIAALLLNIVGFAVPDTSTAIAKRHEAMRLVSVLPASDGVAVFDSKRFFNDALPKVLVADPAMLAFITMKLTEAANETGIDLRKFDQVVVGVTMKQVTPEKYDFEPVAIASGDINAGALVAVARLASNGTYRQEKIGERTVYVFSAKAVAQKNLVNTTNSKIAGFIDKVISGLTKEVAVTALDKNTLVIGSPDRVRATLEATTHVGADVVGLLSVKETAVMSFALKTPSGGMSKLLPLDNDELGTNIDSIQYLSGSLDIAAAGTSIQMTGRTKNPDQAKGLKDTIEGLQVVGGAIFGGSKRADQQVYGRMIKNAKLDLRGTDVSLNLMIPQADIDILIAGVK